LQDKENEGTKMTSERADFTSKIGMILATAGSAVGLGNFWRFPVMTGNNGGAAFILVYVLCVVLFGVPLMTAEFIVGRHAHTNTAQAYKKLTNGWLWRKIGKFGVFTGWFILCYYIVVSGWTLDYFVDSILNRFNQLAHSGNANAYANYFKTFVSNPFLPIIYTAIFMLLSHFIIVRGVTKGIERFSKILMPLLFIIMIILAVCSLFTSGAREGLTFLFKPDFSKITYKTILDALGQSFYSLSIAMGCITTYASYFTKDVKLVNTAFKVCGIDTLVAIMAGMMIFPAVFSTGIRPDAGASLVFIALPNVFQQAFGGIPALAYLVSSLFFFLLVLATLTSVISLHEVVTAYLSENFSMSRKKAASIVTVICIFVGSLCSLSMGPLDNIKILGRNLFDFFDFFSGQIMLPIGGLLIALFVGWFMRRRVIWEQLTNKATLPTHGFRSLITLLKFFVPIAIFMIFLSGIGVLQMF
jgi:NSS family neurotransmitter:Na+ symporter